MALNAFFSFVLEDLCCCLGFCKVPVVLHLVVLHTFLAVKDLVRNPWPCLAAGRDSGYIFALVFKVLSFPHRPPPAWPAPGPAVG